MGNKLNYLVAEYVPQIGYLYDSALAE